MEILGVDLIRRERGERVFRHGAIGPLVMWILFVLPVPLAILWRAELGDVLRSIPWPAWLVLVPMGLVCGALWCLCLGAVGEIAYRALLPSNWLLRVSPAGLVLKLRSYQNAHFPDDGPTVVLFAWPELRSARKVVERSTRRGKGGAPTLERKSWIELELAGLDTDDIERLVAAERTRPAPERSFLGMRSRTRSHHVPVFVERPGVVRIDWLGSGALLALGDHVEIAPPLTLDLDVRPGVLDARLSAFLARGDRMAAVELARRELGLSLAEARARVEALERQAA